LALSSRQYLHQHKNRRRHALFYSRFFSVQFLNLNLTTTSLFLKYYFVAKFTNSEIIISIRRMRLNPYETTIILLFQSHASFSPSNLIGTPDNSQARSCQLLHILFTD
jgi:hypothetical protein